MNKQQGIYNQMSLLKYVQHRLKRNLSNKKTCLRIPLKYKQIRLNIFVPARIQIVLDTILQNYNLSRPFVIG